MKKKSNVWLWILAVCIFVGGLGLLSESIMIRQEDIGSGSTAPFESVPMADDSADVEIQEITLSFDSMEVHFIDVGQGDATLIKCGDSAMLIDTGDDSKGTAIQNYLQKQGIEKLDYLILTHPDSDHIGGAPVIITKFEIDTVFVSNYEKDNKTYRKLIQALDDKRLKSSTPEVGSTYSLGTANFTIIAPNGTYSDSNNASIALILQNGENKFLFTGDAEKEAEDDILKNGINLTADVYKAGHHGSKTSSGSSFLDAVSPAYAVISCAEGNEKGHPHSRTLNNLRECGIKVFRTDEQGSIVAASDGKEITWNAAPSETWQAGEPTGSSSSSNISIAAAAESNISSIADNHSTPQIQETQPPAEVTIAAEEPVSNSLSYVLNSKTKKFHYPSCSYLPTTNRKDSTLSRNEIISNGYEPCKKCNP